MLDLDQLLLQAEARERSATEAAAYARGYADAIRQVRDQVIAAQQAAAAMPAEPPPTITSGDDVS